MIPRVLSIAGTDPTGGAGLHADLKAIAAAGGYGMGVVSSLVVQNTQGVQQVHTPEPEFLRAQLKAVSDDVVIDAVKIGMLADETSTQVVVEWLDEVLFSTQESEVPIIVDPVMVASSGDALADSVSHELLHRASIITPNLDELALLLHQPPAKNPDDMVKQAQELAQSTGSLVLAKGGHLPGKDKGNFLVGTSSVIAHAKSPQITTTASHGTGCSLSSALACRIANGDSLPDAVQWSTAWVREALEFGEDLQVGHGNGPLDHFHRLRRQAQFSLQIPHSTNSSPSRRQAVVPAAGPFTQQLWELAGEALERFSQESIVPALMQGTLSAEQFHFYVEQDDYYLQVYSSVLARLSSLAPHEEERKMWAKAVTQTITVEQEMHREFPLPKIVEPSPLTLAYTDFLRAEVASDYVVGVAAILPCFWLYAQLSEYLPEEIKDDHPYKLWIETYRDEEFLRATAQALEVMEHQLTHASNAQREQARNAFVRACSLEADFFTQALLIDPR